MGYSSTLCMLYSLYAKLCVKSQSWHAEVERDELTSCSYISKHYFSPGRMPPSEWMRSVRDIRYTPVGDNSQLASIPCVTLHIPLRLHRHCFLSLCRSPILTEHSGVVANYDNTLESVHAVRASIGIAMRWVMLRKSFPEFLLPACKMRFSLY